jgi:hypothetical protein
MILLFETFFKFAFAGDEETGDHGIAATRIIFFLSWIFKGFFGYVSDKVFLFKYRSKGYICLLSFSNAVIASLCVWNFYSGEKTGVVVQVSLWVCIFNLAFLDAVTRNLQ